MKKTSLLFLSITALALAACHAETAVSTQQVERKAVESNQQQLVSQIPPPRLTTSLERKNLAERLERINQQNMSGFIYLLSYGRVVSSYPVRGKVSSLNAYLMGSEKPEDDPNGTRDAGSIMVEQPDFDGAYGKNADGVFFFTADTNAYVEWQGEYLFSDQPLKLAQEPLMVREVK